ncbi:phosphate ABC transporter ATP-binding protein (plasmid) [Streptomyces sp. BHT-5-2]|uniref:ABC transporter ATP-binding protein n=1 Tax=unclassified Streptomyces TaxID=2593676 RepID=UPI001C8E579F|nr:phosphate ABC transporter ATP-binding protein [Streptomyces sp. BHT-5-2]QZL08981.1 phosphate ABC transporter ATP-binding protein [Streptomyces sp. BHT-5-2]
MVGGELFVLEDVTVRHGNTVLLGQVTCTVGAGMCTALVGPSGAGKSTLLRLLNRMAEPTSGRVLLHGRPLPDWDVLMLRRRVGLVGQQPVLLTEHVVDELRVGRPGLSEDEARVLLVKVGLSAALLARPTAGLSGGEAQRLCLARALAVRPEVLLLDEPTSALDAASARAIEESVRELLAAGLSVVLVSHNTAQARRLADRALVLREGRLVASGPADEVAYLKEER